MRSPNVKIIQLKKVQCYKTGWIRKLEKSILGNTFPLSVFNTAINNSVWEKARL